MSCFLRFRFHLRFRLFYYLFWYYYAAICWAGDMRKRYKHMNITPLSCVKLFITFICRFILFSIQSPRLRTHSRLYLAFWLVRFVRFAMIEMFLTDRKEFEAHGCCAQQLYFFGKFSPSLQVKMLLRFWSAVLN